MPPTRANGKICYLEIPATDIAHSADFYGRAFGWHIRQRGDGSTAFDDTTGEVSGAWVLGRPPASEPGLLVYVMSTTWPRPLTRSSPTVARWCGRSAPTRPRSLRGFATLLET